MTTGSNQHSDHVHEIREALRCAAAGDPSQVNLALDALNRLQEQLEAAQAENRMLRMWLCTDGAMARGLAESMTELPIAFSVEGVEENCARIVELLNIEQRLGLPSASNPSASNPAKKQEG